jgi:EmrB/QacA subfamily drug resistance transporter
MDVIEREPATSAPPPRATALTHREIMTTLYGLLLGMLLAALDQNIVTTAVPAIASDLGGFEHLSWIFAGYLLTSTASTPIYGKISDLYGRAPLLTISIALFVASSVFCALAQNMGQLVAARALQGLGGGGMMSVTQALIADIISPRERGRYQAYFAGVWAAASVAGPMLGGFFVEYLTWRWVFWINLPVGALALILCTRAFKKLPKPSLARRSIDYWGAALLTASVTALLLVSTWGGSIFPWFSTEVLCTLAVGLVLLGLFMLQELRAVDPILPMRLFSSSIFNLANAISFIVAISMFGGIVLMPVQIQLVLGISPGSTGLIMIPLMSGTVTGSFIAGRIMRRTGRYKWIPPVGIGAATVAFALLATLTATTPPILVLIYLGVLGLGIGPTFPVMMIAIQNTCEARDIGVATSWVFFARSLGASFGAALLWSGLLAALTGRLENEGQGALATALVRGGPTAAGNMAAGDRLLILPALTHAFHIVFLIAAAIALVAFVVTFFLKEERLKSQVPAHRLEGH